MSALEAAGVRISQTGKGRAADNGQMENLWYSLMYEGLRHVQAANLVELRKTVNRYFIQHNGDGADSALAYRYASAACKDRLGGVSATPALI